MPELVFTHPLVGAKDSSGTFAVRPLRVSTGADKIVWSYGLNTANFQTYGGEVVQILSVYFDDLQIEGTVRSYKQLEEIYTWFIAYMRVATQGGNFNATPVQMTYQERGWSFDLYPKSLPGFKYGRDVVAPTWHLEAAVAEVDQAYKNIFIDEMTRKTVENTEGIELFGKTTAEIGFNPHDPFSGPTEAQYKEGKIRDFYGNVADRFNDLIPTYASGDFSDLATDYSRPTIQGPSTETGVDEATKEASKKKKKK